jgi:Putative auto-transporter adhesin, head GIN domain
MRRLLPVLAAAALLAAAAGCGGGPRVTVMRDVPPFDRIEVSDDLDVDVVPGAGGQVRVRAGRDVMERVHTESRDGVLELDIVDRGIVIGPDPLGDVRIEVPVQSLTGVLIEGSGDVAVRGIDEDRLELQVRGAGDIEASGTVDHLSATIQGAGDADLADLEARTADITVQGAGDADLRVSDELDVTVEGAADVSYLGDPIVQSEIDGAGELRRARP